ncbi:IS3 family transposase [Bacillus sp. FSL K6-0067]
MSLNEEWRSVQNHHRFQKKVKKLSPYEYRTQAF